MDFGPIFSLVHRPRQTQDVRFAGERLALNLRALLPHLQARAPGALSGQLLQDLHGMADSALDVVLVLPSASGPARIESGRRQTVIPATLRDAVLAFVRQAAPDASAAPTSAAAAPISAAAPAGSATPAAAFSAAATPASLTVSLAVGTAAPQVPTADAAALARGLAASAQASVAIATAAGAFGMRASGRPLERDRGGATVGYAQPLFAPSDAAAAVDATAYRLRTIVENSGLFFESHMAEWVRGERSDESIAQELLRILPNPGQQERSPPAGSPPTALRAGPPEGERAPSERPSGARVAAQLDVLQHQGVILQGPAWHGQPMTLAITRQQREGSDGAEGRTDVFETTLTLDLPRLGNVQAHLRLSGTTVAVSVESPHTAEFDAALPDLRAALEAHGLVPVLLQAVMTTETGGTATGAQRGRGQQ